MSHLAAGVGEIVARAGRIRTREDLPVERARRQLLERQIQQLEVILGVVRTSVPRPQDPREHLSATGHQQRVEAEPALVMPGRVLLLGVHVDRGGVEVEDHPVRRGARRPRPRASGRPGRADPSELVLPDREHHPPRRRDRRHIPEQRRLARQGREVRHAPTAVREHHRQVADNPAGIVRRAPLARALKRVAQTAGETDPIGDQRQQRAARPRRQARAVRPDIYRFDTPTSHHLQGEPPERGDR